MPQVVIFGRPGLRLQGCLDDFALCAVDVLPVTSDICCTKTACQGSQIQYNLMVTSGVSYLSNQHFTEHVITDTGFVWSHDRMFTGRFFFQVGVRF